jgi:serine/threonine protein kinase
MTDSERIEELLLNWDDLRERGTALTAEELCREHPELTSEVARRIKALEAVYRVPNAAGNLLATKPFSPPRSPEKSLPHLDDYEILELLGSGGMGQVFKAYQKSLKRLVALKMILTGRHASQAENDRFRTEAEAVAQLQHPNIVQIHEVGAADGCAFLALEFVSGGSLEERLQGDPLPPGQAAELVRTLAAAMQHAHERHIIHRDLKPANILLTADGTPKIADFGLAKNLEESGHTRSGSVLGTPAYMAPEQAEGQLGRIGPATDVYALGAILYQVLTGQPPFQGTTLLETLEKVRTEEPIPPRRVKPDVPGDLETICLKCLQKEPRDRYASAKELADDLQRFLDDEPILVRAPTLVDRLKFTLNRTRGLPDLTRSVRFIRAAVASLFLIQVVVLLATWGRPAYPYVALWMVLGPLPVVMGAHLIYTGEGWRVPLTATTRHFWSVRLGILIGLYSLAGASWLMHPPGSDWNPLRVFPPWGVLLGAIYFSLGVYWGWLYPLGLVHVAVALLMTSFLELAPFILMGSFALTLWAVSGHIRRMAQERAGSTSSKAG